MTICTVTLCDDTFTPITDPKIDIEACDPATSVSIDKVGNAKISSSPTVWGGSLTVSSTDIYNVVIDTTGTSYAPNVLENLNGDKTPELDIILFNASAAKGSAKGPGPSNSTAISAYVRGQAWSTVTKKAVFSSIRTFSFLRTLPEDHFEELRQHLEAFLRDININPDLIA